MVNALKLTLSTSFLSYLVVEHFSPLVLIDNASTTILSLPFKYKIRYTSPISLVFFSILKYESFVLKDVLDSRDQF